MPATFTAIQNENELYSHHYLAELFANDIQATTARWRESAAESANGARTPGPTAGGGAYPTCSIVSRGRLYIPIPEEISASFIPAAGEEKRLEVRAENLRTEST